MTFLNASDCINLYMNQELEWQTRRERINTKLTALNPCWDIIKYSENLDLTKLTNHAVEEFPTNNGPADYALFVNGKLIGIIEAKKVSVNPQNVLEQAKRYSRGVSGIGNWNGYGVPFLYASNGESIWFEDVRLPKTLPRLLSTFHTPLALAEYSSRDDISSFVNLKSTKILNMTRYYQRNAVLRIEDALRQGKRKMLVAIATGTGKTYTSVSSIYRLIKSGVVKRVLFLVDRKALAAQTAVAFAAYETPSGNKFNQEYEVYSQRFKKEDMEDAKFDVSVLPNEYLTNPDASKTFVYVSTIQRMAINLLGKSAVFTDEVNDSDDEDTDMISNIPIHAFDLIIADECHRGYTSKDTSVWRSVLEYFDGIKIGLTATPAFHTVSYFDKPVYRYTVDEAVNDGFLVDYDAVKINSNVRMNGMFLQEGEQIGKIDYESGQETLEQLEDERAFDASEVERKITSPDSNEKIINEFANFALEFEKQHGRFPKTLIFAANDMQHISHADRIVSLCKKIFNRGDDFVAKITGNPNVDRPLQKIRKFRNLKEPAIVITVDMLSTGVDIPALEYIVFMRPVKSRILWEQMLGRGTRLCPEINKEKFTIFDCFDGTLIEYFKDVSNFQFSDVTYEPIPIEEVIRRINDNEDREHNVKVFIKRLRRIEKAMSSEARDQFKPYIENGDVGAFADKFNELIKKAFADTMDILNNKDFQNVLKNYKRAKPVFYVAYPVEDEVSSELLFEAGQNKLKPEEYLAAFQKFVKENQNKVDAISIILNRPKEWKTKILDELKAVLIKNHFPKENLEKVYGRSYQKNLVDIITMIRNAAFDEPVIEASERVKIAVDKAFEGKDLSQEQLLWVGYIKNHLVTNLTIGKDDLTEMATFSDHGGVKKFKELFGGQYENLLSQINTQIASVSYA